MPLSEIEILEHYKRLDLVSNVTKEECTAKYKKLILKYHPDKGNTPDHSRFCEIQESYKILMQLYSVDPNIGQINKFKNWFRGLTTNSATSADLQKLYNRYEQSKDNKYLLFIACIMDEIDMVKTLINDGNLNNSIGGHTPIIWALKYNSCNTLKYLFKHPALDNNKTIHDMTVLVKKGLYLTDDTRFILKSFLLSLKDRQEKHSNAIKLEETNKQIKILPEEANTRWTKRSFTESSSIDQKQNKALRS